MSITLTDEERDEVTSCCNRSDCQGTFAAVERVLTARMAEANALIQYALTICMYGERAPGGDENWAEFGKRAETYVRSLASGAEA